MLKWNSNVKLGFVSMACYGGGVGPGTHRNTTNNNIVKRVSDLISGVSSAWWDIAACATHTGWSRRPNSECSVQLTYLYNKLKKAHG